MKVIKKKKPKKKYFLGGLVLGAAGKAFGAQAGKGAAKFLGKKLAKSKLGQKLGMDPSESGEQGDITITISKDGDTTSFKKGGSMAGLSAAQKEVYRRGLAAYMSSGNRPKVSQHAWAMARVKSDFGKKEAAKIRAKKGKKK